MGLVNCEPCTLAQDNPRTGIFQSGCLECQARMLAHSPHFYESSQSNTLTPSYRNALRAVFGEDWRKGHELVKQWSKRLK